MSAAAVHPLRKRLLAVVIGLCAIGVGHYFLGAGRAGAVWAASVIAALSLAIAAMLLGLPMVALVGLGLTVTVQIAALFDLLRPRSTASPATARVVGLFVLVLGLGEGFRTVVRAHLVEAFGIPGQSMSPTLEPGDQILVSKLKQSPARGDVIVFQADDGAPYVKRVLAVAGDIVEMRDNAMWLNGKELPHHSTTERCRIEDPCKVLEETSSGRTYRIALTESPMRSLGKMEQREIPPGHVFVLGDGRDWSNDSRSYGAIPLDRIMGSLEFVWWPSSRFGAR